MNRYSASKNCVEETSPKSFKSISNPMRNNSVSKFSFKLRMCRGGDYDIIVKQSETKEAVGYNGAGRTDVGQNTFRFLQRDAYCGGPTATN